MKRTMNGICFSSRYLAVFLVGACTTASLQSTQAERSPAFKSTSPVTTLATAPKVQSPTGTTTVQHLARGKNAYVGRLVLEANAKVPKHRDATEEFIVVLEGGGMVSINEQQFEVGPGDTIYMPAQAEVRYENGNQQTTALQIFAGPSPANKYASWAPSPAL